VPVEEAAMMEQDVRGGHYAAELQAPEVYRERRRRLAERVGGGTVVLWGAGDDRGYGDIGTFRQEPNFFYLTGVELPNAALVLRPHERYEALFLPLRDPNLERWTGPKWGPDEEAAKALGFDQVLAVEPSEQVIQARRRPVPGFADRLQQWLSEPEAVLWVPLRPVASSSELPAVHRLVAGLRDRGPSFTVRDLTRYLTELRQIKDEGEIALIRKAVAATIKAHRRAARALRPGVAEGAVDGIVYAAFRESGAEGVAFPSIVGSGYNATTLHYDHNRGSCRDGELVVVDIGARYGYYCGDVTRTYPVNGRFSERQREIYELVLEVHDRVAEAIRPGTTMAELRELAYGVMEGSSLTNRAGEPLGQYFIHGLGHPLGLEAHDPGDDAAPLEPGMVVTNEPGIYLPEEALGVRLEDDHLVTEDGNENLSAELPTAPDEIEAMMRGDERGRTSPDS
jgi:Xaa-Pro aminopeptidase